MFSCDPPQSTGVRVGKIDGKWLKKWREWKMPDMMPLPLNVLTAFSTVSAFSLHSRSTQDATLDLVEYFQGLIKRLEETSLVTHSTPSVPSTTTAST